MKIVIVEDEMRIKEGLSNLIKKLYPDCEVAAMADNGKDWNASAGLSRIWCLRISVCR